MTKFLISFPSAAMVAAPEDMPAIGTASRAVIQESKDAGVYVFAGGIDEATAPVMVTGDGTVSADLYPGSALNGGFCVLELASREQAELWAGKLAAACRCGQELRAFMYDPMS